MKIAVVIPFSKPRESDNVRANLARQLRAPDAVFIVENGPGLGAFAEGRPPGAHILTSKAHQSAAKMAGWAAVDQLAADDAEPWWIAIFDCDDYYGPRYLAEYERRALEAKVPTVFGKWRMFVHDDRGMFLPEMESEGPVSWTCGATHFFPVDLKSHFPEVPTGEDTAFCAYARASGAHVVAAGYHDFCYVRTTLASHTFREDYRLRLEQAGIRIQNVSPHLNAALVDGPPAPLTTSD